MPAAPRHSPQEALELPDLDKADDSDEVDVGAFELDVAEDGEPAGDDVFADTFEVDIQVLTDSGSNEAASELDVGVSDLLGDLPETPDARDSDAPAPSSDDLDMHLEAPLESDETSSDAELGDDGLETLPELVSEEGDGDAGPDLEQAFLPSAPEGAIAKGPSHETEWLLLGGACSALWAGNGVVLGAGEKLMHFGATRKSDDLPPGVRIGSLVSLDGERVLLATTRGLLEQQAGATWAQVEPPDAPRGGASDVVELATAPGEPVLWARLAGGALLRRRAGQWERHEAGGEVRALTSHERRISLLVIAKRPTLQLSSDAGTSFRELLLPEPAATVALGAAATVVSQGSVIALADPARGLCVSNDGGESFRMVTGAVNVTAIALGEHAGAAAVFAALHREGKDATELVLVEPAAGIARSIAELSGQADEDAEETGRTQALLWSDGYLWCAGGYGLVRLRS